ncbi:MAG TPA: hypothetical protein VK498_14085, partial [Ferruginibacter sp.]|nr:hypothetical protein [Ferruginibacter sp.]
MKTTVHSFNFKRCGSSLITIGFRANLYFLLVLSCLILGITFPVNAQSGIYESYAIVKINSGSNNYYDLQATTANPDFNGANLGTFLPGNSLTLNGAQNKTFKCATDQITNPNNLYYRVYKTIAGAPSFTSSTIFWTSDDGLTGSGCGGSDQNQTWQSAAANINILNGLTPGNYYLEIYTTADFTFTSGGGGNGTHYANNSSANYKAQFTLAANCVTGIAVSPSSVSPVCINGSGTQLTATITTASGSGDASITYEWFSNTSNSTSGGTSVQGPTTTTTATTTSTFTPPTNTAGTLWYYCTVINTDPTCSGSFSTSPVEVIVNPAVTPAVTISANPGNVICAGTSVTFTATPVNGGPTPSYQWYIGATPVGTNSPNYTSSALVNTNQVKVVMTSSDPCASPVSATSNIITMTVNDLITPSVTISANPGNTICLGTSVTFTADLVINGGTSPVI